MRTSSNNCPQAIRRLIIAVFLACIFGSAASAAPLERWVYAQVNLLVPEEAQRLEALVRRACFVSGLLAR